MLCDRLVSLSDRLRTRVAAGPVRTRRFSPAPTAAPGVSAVRRGHHPQHPVPPPEGHQHSGSAPDLPNFYC
jgi:hypothetical protein